MGGVGETFNIDKAAKGPAAAGGAAGAANGLRKIGSQADGLVRRRHMVLVILVIFMGLVKRAPGRCAGEPSWFMWFMRGHVCSCGSCNQVGRMAKDEKTGIAKGGTQLMNNLHQLYQPEHHPNHRAKFKIKAGTEVEVMFKPSA